MIEKTWLTAILLLGCTYAQQSFPWDSTLLNSSFVGFNQFAVMEAHGLFCAAGKLVLYSRAGFFPRDH